VLPVAFALTIGLTPAPAEVLSDVQELEVESATGEASMFRLRIGITRRAGGSWSTVDADLFRPLVRVGIRIQAGVGRPSPVINGYVAGQEVRYAEKPGRSTLEVTGMDATLLMGLDEKVAAWPNMPDSTIAAAIFGEYFVTPRVAQTAPGLVEPDGTTLQRSSDIRFLRKLARRNGFECFVQPDPSTGIDFGYFGPAQTVGMPQAVLSVSMGTETNVRDFSVRYEMTRPTSVIATGLDVRTKEPQSGSALASVRTPLGAEPSLLRLSPAPVVRPAESGLVRSGELRTLSEAIADRSSYAVVARGTVGPEVGVLRPGEIMSVRGPGRLYGGVYYVTRVHHTIGARGYLQRFEARRNAVGMTGTEAFAIP
jgi:phage protein D